MNTILRKIISSYDDDKRKVDKRENIFVYFVARPISYILTIVFIKQGISANKVSILSAISALTGSIMIAFGEYDVRLFGSFFIFLWIVLDCVDGNIARYHKASSGVGEYLDAMGGYIVNASIFMAIGIAAFNSTNQVIFLYMGYLASISSILSRLLHHKWMNSVGGNNIFTRKGSRGLLISTIQNFAAVSNFFQVFLIIAILFQGEKYLISAYTFINFSILMYTIFRLPRSKHS